MKNLNLLLLLLIVPLFGVSQSMYYVSAENGLFARSAPDRGARTITKLHYGTKVQITEQTDLRLDVLDHGKKISGQWVKVNAYLPYDTIEAYVFDAFLTNKILEPRTHAKFDNVTVALHNLELWETEGQSFESKRDTLRYYAELGVSPEEKIIVLKPQQNYKRLAVYQAYETSLTVMNEGPHCDLIDWKHYQSAWLPLKHIEEQTYQTLSYSQDDWSEFVTVDMDDLKSAVREHCGDGYAELIKSLKTIDYPAAVSISIIYLKVIMIDMDDKVIERIIAFEIPMGC
ncbi:MAG: SH3 domain-containing protein [Flavobacteriaceae bacterium]|nr:SH3 domain-containing protein [Bacteroidia bacterium]MBT8288925.1 SH3 domain-containing protein [Bacteroidia bacterium]NNF74108.1 SH3 domain-containing protein [Flavobacteriaceae bacterium]NNK71817.1 SH3 domain-containing protein [Flavobacteriaceae bacterium]